MKRGNNYNAVGRYSWLLTMFLFIAGCATPEMEPARNPTFARIESIAVLAFQGKDGDIFAKELESTLISLQRRQGVSFRVVTRARGDIRALEEELRYQKSGATESALQLGKAMRVSAVMIGQIDTTSESNRFTANEVVCVKPKGLFGCKEKRSRAVTCTRETVATRVVPRLLDVESGQVLYSNILDGNGIKVKCPSNTYSVETDPYRQARDKILREIARDVAPHTEATWGNFFR